jgi:predicted aspartyl protease
MSEIVLSQEYDHRNFDPAMPILDIGLSQPEARTPAIFAEAEIDTGADGTLIPIHFLESIGAPAAGAAFLRGVTGDRRRVKFHMVTLYLGELRIYGVRAVGLSEGDTVILGRDVINQLDLTLHDPAEVLEVLK